MVSSESAFLMQAPHHTKHVNGDKGNVALTGLAARRPRNREVTSRYKASPTTSGSPAPVPNQRFPTPNPERSRTVLDAQSPGPSPNRRFPTPNVDRAGATHDIPSPKRAVSVERRRPSPTRTTENNSLKVATDAGLPLRAGVRAELLWPSTRSLTTSMQFEPQSLPPSGQAKKPMDSRGKSGNVTADQTLRPSANVVPRLANSRKPTPERKATPLRCQNIDQAENAQPQENVQKSDQRGQYGSSNPKMTGVAMSRSTDLSADRERHLSRAALLLVQGKSTQGSSSGSQHVAFSRAQSHSINEGPSLSSVQRTRSESRGRRRDSPLRSRKCPTKDSPPSVSSYAVNCGGDHVVHPARHSEQEAVDLAHLETSAIPDNASDTDSVSSVGTATTSSSGRGTSGNVSVMRGVRGTTVPSRIWQDAANRSRRSSENKLRSSMPESELLAATTSVRAGIKYKTADSPQGSHALMNGGAPTSPWSTLPRFVSGLLPSQQPPSPSQTSPYRIFPSPLRSRTGPPPASGQRSSSAAMMLNFGADVRKGRKGLSLVEEIHLHRILHNRLLQWQLVNARTEGAMNEQAFAAEKTLYNVCVRIFDLRSSVIAKKIRLHRARQAQMINSLLSVQTTSLEEWSLLQHEHFNALKGAVQALEAAVLRVPVTGGGVKADALAVQDAISSAFDVMNSVENTVAYLLPKADKTNCLVSELGFVAAQERALLEECASLLGTASTLEGEECSLRTHLVQSEHERARVLGHLMMDNMASAPDSVLV